MLNKIQRRTLYPMLDNFFQPLTEMQASAALQAFEAMGNPTSYKIFLDKIERKEMQLPQGIISIVKNVYLLLNEYKFTMTDNEPMNGKVSLENGQLLCSGILSKCTTPMANPAGDFILRQSEFRWGLRNYINAKKEKLEEIETNRNGKKIFEAYAKPSVQLMAFFNQLLPLAAALSPVSHSGIALQKKNANYEQPLPVALAASELKRQRSLDPVADVQQVTSAVSPLVFSERNPKRQKLAPEKPNQEKRENKMSIAFLTS